MRALAHFLESSGSKSGLLNLGDLAAVDELNLLLGRLDAVLEQLDALVGERVLILERRVL
jgi:hypothetical protein